MDDEYVRPGKFRKPIFEGNFDPDHGWSNAAHANSGNWTTIQFGPPSGWGQPQVAQDQPFLRGAVAHAWASTETTLARRPEVIHDANGYYRLFGFSFPFLGITIKQLRQRYLAYIARTGIEDERMTYVMTLLRDKEIRAKYDVVPFWERFLDKYFQEWLKQQALKMARERNLQQGLEDEDGIEAADILSEWGYGVEPDAEPGAEGDDAPELPPGAEVSDEDATVPWLYSYYLWRSTCDDTETLSLWQELLLAEFSKVGMKLRFAVGFMGRQPQEWVTGEVQNQTVVYLDEDTWPTEELAAKAVASLNDGRTLTNG